MFWYAYAKATFNTVYATLAKREIKFKTTEKSVLSANVTDEANKAKVKSKKNASPARQAWSQVLPLPGFPPSLDTPIYDSQSHNLPFQCGLIITATMSFWLPTWPGNSFRPAKHGSSAESP